MKNFKLRTLIFLALCCDFSVLRTGGDDFTGVSSANTGLGTGVILVEFLF